MAEENNQPSKPRVRVPLRIEETIAGITIGLLALITFANVVVRYATNFSFAFTEEFSIFLMVFMALVGGSSVMAKGGHLNINLIVGKFFPSHPQENQDCIHRRRRDHLYDPCDPWRPDGL
jgi:TRAP-type C4-dicarboxylate transport system permease small subunit